MPVIGTFARLKDGQKTKEKTGQSTDQKIGQSTGQKAVLPDGYAGSITTLTLNTEVAILANERKQGSNAPDFRVMAGTTEVGVAWRKISQNAARPYLRVKLDDPALAEPIWGALLETGEDGVAELLWQRDWQDDRD
jgi:uncharacterized protein (DUF736 family)